MKNIFRPSTWFDTDKKKEVFGIKVQLDGKWLDAGDDNGPLFFDTEKERDTAMVNLEKKGIPASA